mmetsp:Transcript_17399/g.39819  ORF Transcript_17399/g.39819 Transcript_17399/m.39819 type:complete len:87 (-) Transcript_17399:319-579(-)
MTDRAKHDLVYPPKAGDGRLSISLLQCWNGGRVRGGEDGGEMLRGIKKNVGVTWSSKVRHSLRSDFPRLNLLNLLFPLNSTRRTSF